MADFHSTTSYRDIPGYPGYRVGDDGSVWTCLLKISRGNGGGTRQVPGEKWRRLKPWLHRSGRLVVHLRGRKKYVHHLVLEAFVGPCPPGMEACHFPDSDATNNRLCNLRWATHSSNEGDKLFHGTHNRGERDGQAKLNEEQVRGLRSDYAAGMTYSELERKYGISRAQARRIVSRQRWAHLD